MIRRPRRFAQGTTVPAAQSRAEIEKIVRGRGAKEFGSYTTEVGTSVLFSIHDRRIRFELPMPPNDPAEERRRWRCLVLNIKAKFEAVENYIVTFDEEFLAHIVIPTTDGETVGSRVGPLIQDAYERGIPLLTQ